MSGFKYQPGKVGIPWVGQGMDAPIVDNAAHYFTPAFVCANGEGDFLSQFGQWRATATFNVTVVGAATAGSIVVVAIFDLLANINVATLAFTPAVATFRLDSGWITKPGGNSGPTVTPGYIFNFTTGAYTVGTARVSIALR